MLNQEIQDYIKKAKEAAMSDEQIKDELLKSGRQKEEVEENFSLFNSLTATKPNRRRRIKKIIIGILIFLFFLFNFFYPPLFIYPILGIFYKDIPAVDDSDLQLAKIAVSDNDNAYFDLIKLEGNIFTEINGKNLLDDIVNDKIWDQQYVDELLKKNEAALSIFNEVAEKTKYQNPILADPEKISIDMALPSMGPWRNIAKISSVKAASLAKNGEGQEALEETLKIIKIGHEMQNSQGTLIEYLVGVAIETLGLKINQQIIQTANLSPEILIFYSQKLNAFKGHTAGLVNVFKGEYLVQKSIIQDMATGKYFNTEDETAKELIKKCGAKGCTSFIFMPNRTIQIFVDLTRAQIKGIESGCHIPEEVEKLFQKYQNLFTFSGSQIIDYFRLMYTPNGISKVLMQIVAVNLGTVNTRKCNEDLMLSSSQLLSSLKAYKIESGLLPSSLDMLIPKYNETTPEDPFDKAPLKYSPEKKIIYSVGSDSKDSGGSEGDDWTLMPDPTFKIEF